MAQEKGAEKRRARLKTEDNIHKSQRIRKTVFWGISERESGGEVEAEGRLTTMKGAT